MLCTMTLSLSRLEALLATLDRRRQRALLWIAANTDVAQTRGLALWRARQWQAPLWLGPELESSQPDITPLPSAKSRTRLGGEHDLVIFDAGLSAGGFDPDAFGAVSGTLRAGGLLVLLTPQAWLEDDAAADEDYARIAAWPHQASELSSHYLKRLARLLGASPLVLSWPADQTEPTLALPEAMAGLSAEPSQPRNDLYLSDDQAEAVSRLGRLRRRRPLVLTADRGRGKSAALGIAAAQRLLQGERRVWVTAPRPAAVEPLFERLAGLLPQGQREANAFRVSIEDESAEVRFLAPDAVIEALESPDIDSNVPPVLFVDEAAAIPAPLLGRWLKAFPRIAYATTIHGYEGTGRGFALRFRERLERETPNWRELHLSQPVRWAEGDPLEALTRRLLLLDAEPADDSIIRETLGEQELRLISLDREALARDEQGLSEVFGLLVQAHYRTTPADLRQLLDAPGLRLIGAYLGDHCVGICLGQDEGGFPSDLATAIQRGERRPRGHLLAQSLATHGGYRQAAEVRWCRVMRIAVHPAARRHGIGRALIERMSELVSKHGIDRLGTSFGAEIGLIDFWRALGFVSLRVGLSREASSGEHALMMGQGLDASSRAQLAHWAQDFQRLLPGLLAFELKWLESKLAASLLFEGEAPVVDAQTWARIEWFAAGGGELALVRPWLADAWLAWWRSGNRSAEDELVSLVAPLYQDIQHGHLAGRKALLAARRAMAKRLLRCPEGS